MISRNIKQGQQNCERHGKAASPSFQTMVGGSSLLVIFAVLCLTVFALLSLNTVLADRRLAEASAKSVTAYYEADCRAEEIFARLRMDGRAPEADSSLPDEPGICRTKKEEGYVYTYSCPISETQTLWVELLQKDDIWTVLRWQAVAKTQSQEVQQELWDGETTS